MAKKKTSPRKKAKSRVIAGKGTALQRLQSSLSRKPALLLVVALVGTVGIYLLATGSALPGFGRGVPADDPARGLVYRGLKKASTGPCRGEFVAEQADETAKDVVCTHVDPGPEGIDVRERARYIEQQLNAQADYDETYLSDEPEATVPEGTPPLVTDEAITGGSLGEISGRNWACVGDGVAGKRVKWLYVYKSGSTNRLKDVKRTLVSIAKRTNAVVYNSSKASNGTAQHIRFETNAKCGLNISAVAVSGDLYNTSNIKSQLQQKGYSSSNRKYLVSVDYGDNSPNVPCGVGERYSDDSASSSNLNNSGPMYAYAWKGCWNYAEPHELIHTLGGVQASAPRATSQGHCTDEKDVMCYKDGSPESANLKIVCPADKKHWMMDCNFNDYYKRGSTSGYLSNYWNTARSNFLTQ